MADSSAQKGAEVPKMVSQTPSASTYGSSAVTDRPGTPSNSKQVAQKFSSWLRGPFSRSKRRKAEPTPAGVEITQNQNPQGTSIAAQDTLLVRAESIHIKDDTVRRKILGAEHPGTILAAANLASTYSAQGRYNEAEKLELEVLEKRRRILGAEHRDTILAAANLASTVVHGVTEQLREIDHHSTGMPTTNKTVYYVKH